MLTRQSLTPLITSLLPLEEQPHGDNKVFLYCLHDWLCYLTHHNPRWNDYDTRLMEVVEEKIIDLAPCYHRWTAYVAEGPLTIKTLLYRHYLMAYVLDQEIFPVATFKPFYVLISTLLTHPPIFYPLPIDTPWQNIHDQVHPINVLRQQRELIKACLHDVAMRDDESDEVLQIDHGLLSSLSLLYGLYLAQAILIHEARVYPSAYLDHVNKTMVSTLTHLQGVLIHVEN